MKKGKRKVRKNLKIGRTRSAFPTRFLICGILIVLQVLITIGLVSVLGDTFIYAQTVQTIFSVLVLMYVLNNDEPAAHKLTWTVVIMLIPLAGALIYCMFGKPQQSRRAKKRFEQVNNEAALYLTPDPDVLDEMKRVSPEAFSLSTYLEKVCNVPAFVNTKTRYYPSGEAFFDALIEDVKRAENYIFLEYFIITPGEVWNSLHDALVERVAAGVRVFILYDDIGSMKKTPTKFDVDLRKEGIVCYKFNPFVPIATTLHNNRDHRKIAVVDGKIAFTGGVNIADEYANVEQPFGRWKDSAVRLEGDAVDGFVFMFTQLYNIFAPEPLEPAEFLCTHEKIEDKKVSDGESFGKALESGDGKNADRESADDGSFGGKNTVERSVAEKSAVDSCGFVQPYGDGPRPMYNDYIGKDLYLGIIYSAKKYLYIATPYLIAGYETEEAIIFAAKRGVDVRIITPHVPDKAYVFAMTRASYAKLIAAGVKIYEYAPGFIHSKIIVADDELGVVGTVNFDYRSFVHHYECGAFIACDPVLKTIREDFLTTALKDGILQTEQSAKLTFPQKIVKTVIGLFAPLL